MGTIRPFVPVKLFVGVLSVEPQLSSSLLGALKETFGTIEEMTEPTPFTYTHYYDAEMSVHPFRSFLIFQDLIDPTSLVHYKLEGIRLEDTYRSDTGGRTVNLDPGTLTMESIILATTKHRSHRLPLGSGIYGELTLMYQHGSFQKFPWTYADYADPIQIEFFQSVRSRYREQLKQLTSH